MLLSLCISYQTLLRGVFGMVYQKFQNIPRRNYAISIIYSVLCSESIITVNGENRNHV